jgi:hypothetical protein
MNASASATGGEIVWEAAAEGGFGAGLWLNPVIAAESRTRTAKRNTGYLAF